MTSRLCKFGCETLLTGWDDNAKKYIEAGTGGLHTRERCEEAKARLAQKNNHGNEESSAHLTEYLKRIPTEGSQQKEFVDHTLPPKLKLTILTDPTAAGLAKLYNDFPHAIKFSQYQLAPPLYTMAVWYEESKP